MNDDSRTDFDVPELEDGARVLEAEVQRRREFARVWITVALVVILGITVVWVLVNAARGPDVWEQTKDALQIILPVEAALLGSAISFYFASNRD